MTEHPNFKKQALKSLEPSRKQLNRIKDGEAAKIEKLWELAGPIMGPKIANILVNVITKNKISYVTFMRDPIAFFEQHGIDVDTLPLSFFDVFFQPVPGRKIP